MDYIQELSLQGARNAIKAHLEAYPSDMPVLMESITDSIRDYEKAIKAVRDRRADMAIHMSMENKPTCLIKSIDAAMYRWPHGLTGNESPSERKWWEVFLSLAAKGVDSDWLSIKGATSWWYTYIRPELTKEEE